MFGQKTHQNPSWWREDERKRIAMMCDVNGVEVEKGINVVWDEFMMICI
jgi:hypothetical protein